MKKLITVLFALSAFILVSGCSSDSTSTPSTLSGTAATGAPIDGTVTVKDADGVEENIATAVDGSFTLNVAGMTPPYLLKVMPSSGPTLYSFAATNGQIVNLAPTTNLAMFLASGKADLDAMYINWDGTAVTAAEVATAEGVVRANLVTQITNASLDPAILNLFTTPFAADGSGIDGVMDDLAITVNTGVGVGYTFTNAAGAPITFDEAAVPPAPPAPPAPGSVSVVAVSGAMVSLDGSYSTGCVDRSLQGGGGFYKDETIIVGSTMTVSGAEYSDAACTAETDSGGAVVTLATTGVTSAITGWIGAGDGGGVFIPQAADGSGGLSTTEAVTPLTATVVSGTGWNAGLSVGMNINLFFVVDDTGVNKVIYEDDDFFSGSTLASNIASTEL